MSDPMSAFGSNADLPIFMSTRPSDCGHGYRGGARNAFEQRRFLKK